MSKKNGLWDRSESGKSFKDMDSRSEIAPELTMDELDAKEAKKYPNRIDPDHWDALLTCVRNFSDSGEGDGSIEDMINCWRLHFHALTDKKSVVADASRINLATLKKQRQKRIDTQDAVDKQIADLEKKVNGRPNKKKP